VANAFVCNSSVADKSVSHWAIANYQFDGLLCDWIIMRRLYAAVHKCDWNKVEPVEWNMAAIIIAISDKTVFQVIFLTSIMFLHHVDSCALSLIDSIRDFCIAEFTVDSHLEFDKKHCLNNIVAKFGMFSL